jgi:threonine dehydratase
VIAIEEIEAARDRIADVAVRTPLVRLQADTVRVAPPGSKGRPDGTEAEIWLKLETLQPIASFKIRGAANAVRRADPAHLQAGLVTASAGNMGRGVAWLARELGLPATIVVPDHAPQTKIDAIERLGGTVVRVPYADWWHAIETSRVDGIEDFFVHPVSDPAVMAGNGTIGLEILEDLPAPDAVLVPYGGGGLVTGIASALRSRNAPTRIYAVEPAVAAGLNAALAAGEPADADFEPSWIDGAGSRRVLPEMFERVRGLVDGAFTASLDETAAAVRLLAERTRVIAEGAGALALAAALAGKAGQGRVVCIVSGGNIDLSTLAPILLGESR